MLLVVDFIKMSLMEVKMDEIDHPLWASTFKRFGSNNNAICMKINTFLMSYEFHLLC